MEISEIVGAAAALINNARIKKENGRLANNLKHHNEDIRAVNSHMNKRLPQIAKQRDIEKLNDLGGFVMEKQGKLAKRHRIPDDIRAEGNRFYRNALDRIEKIRKAIIGTVSTIL